MNFVCPLPPMKVFVRAEYLYDFERGHGELVEGIWCTVKAHRGEAFRFETYLPEYGALYDKLPIHAFLWKPLEGEDLPLDMLQIWDSLSYYVTVVDKPLLSGLRCEFFGKDKKLHPGEYVFTLDGCNPDPRIPDFTFVETVDEHKSYNLIKVDNGQYALQPNNRCRFFDPAFTPGEMKFPDFKVATVKWTVENKAKWRLGDTSTVMYDERGEPDLSEKTPQSSDKNPLPYGSIYQPLVPFGASPPADAHPDNLYVSWDSALHRLFWWNHNTKMWDQVMEQKA